MPPDAKQFTEGSLSVKEQPNTRISEVWVYYGQINPLLDLDRTDNYRSTRVKTAAQVASDYGASTIKKIFSRWIPQFGSMIAERLADILLARYAVLPRLFNFSVARDSADAVALGDCYRLNGRTLQDASGAGELVPVQVRQLNPAADRFQVEAEEMLFSGVELDNNNDRVIIINSDTLNFNLRTAHDSIYPPITDPTGITLTCIINSGVVVGASSTAIAAFIAGSWPAGLSTHSHK